MEPFKTRAFTEFHSTPGFSPDPEHLVSLILPLPPWLKTIPALVKININTSKQSCLLFFPPRVCVRNSPPVGQAPPTRRRVPGLDSFLLRRRCSFHGSFHGQVMSLLLDNAFKPLPPDRSVNTEAFLEAVAHVPSFFGEFGPPHPERHICVAAPSFAHFLVAG